MREIKQGQSQICGLELTDRPRRQEMWLTPSVNAVVLQSEPAERLVEAVTHIGLW
ncbi:MAG TPA: hypothetical protein PKD98_23920 [Anaerolineae bacterium]|nr:hypothetical protein [Anaerolineae bacterium]